MSRKKLYVFSQEALLWNESKPISIFFQASKKKNERKRAKPIERKQIHCFTLWNPHLWNCNKAITSRLLKLIKVWELANYNKRRSMNEAQWCCQYARDSFSVFFFSIERWNWESLKQSAVKKWVGTLCLRTPRGDGRGTPSGNNLSVGFLRQGIGHGRWVPMKKLTITEQSDRQCRILLKNGFAICQFLRLPHGIEAIHQFLR